MVSSIPPGDQPGKKPHLLHGQPSLFLKKDPAQSAASAEARAEVRAKMAGLLGIAIPAHPGEVPTGSPNSVWASQFSALKNTVVRELTEQPSKILALNRTRRDTIVQHLERLAGVAGSDDLTRWMQGHRTSAQNSALQAFLSEIAVSFLGQAVLLKAWSDRGLRPWAREDLNRMNWALMTALKPHIPLDREGWQITRSIYSWYTPSAETQEEIWRTLFHWKFSDEGPGILLGLIHAAESLSRETLPEENRGYDPRFFQALWQTLYPALTLSNEATQWKNRVFFSPTLRDGALVRSGPSKASWIGFEESPFQLILAELVHLWWGPAAPPYWAIGNGLESHTRDQLSLSLGSPKPSLLSRISEMEACELAFVLEERTLRGSSRTAEASRFRACIDKLDYFKKLKTAGTSLGDLQACVALNKLRPGGALIWARQDPLSQQDGNSVLEFILDRAKIVAIWDWSEIEHSLPAAYPVFPKYLYLLVREPGVEARLSNRPLRISVTGQLRSHIELPMFLEDSLRAFSEPVSTRGSWMVSLQKSPSPQREWRESWPDSASQSLVRTLDDLKENSLPLANFTTVRPTPEGDPARDGLWSIHPSLHGVWVQAEKIGPHRKLLSHPLPRPRAETQGSGFLILVPDATWVAPLSAYLESLTVHDWLEHHCERRTERWLLAEQIVKFIPVPKPLLKALGARTGNSDETFFAQPLPGEWERLSSQISTDTRGVRTALDRLRSDPDRAEIRAQLFVRAARAMERLKEEQKRLFAMVGDQGELRWKDFLEILPKSELISIPLQQKVTISGNLAPHIPIGRISRVRSPQAGIILATETGMTLTLCSESALLLEMLWSQVETLVHPTWNEVVQQVRLPRRMDIVESAAVDVLRAHGKEITKLRDLADLVSACLIF